MAKSAKNQGGSIVPFTGAMGIGRIDPEKAVERAASGQTKMRPKVVGLKEPGDYIDGILEGPGTPVEVTDPAGDSKSIGTWIFRGGEAESAPRLALMGSYQLDHELPTAIGKRVRVTYLAQVDTRKGQRVKDFLIEEYLDAEVVEDHAAG